MQIWLFNKPVQVFCDHKTSLCYFCAKILPMRRSYQFSVFVLMFFFTAILKAAPADTLEHALLWKVSGKGVSKPSYLFGTYHLMTGDYTKKVNGLRKAYKKSKVIVGEIQLSADVSAQLMPFMIMQKGTLDSLLGKERFDSLNQALSKRAGLSAAMFNKMKPTAVYTIFATTELQKSGLLEMGKGSPMDLYFQEEGRKQKKEIRGLETVQQQADILFGGATLERQAEMLMQYVRKGSEGSAEQNKKMKYCYSAQNLNCLSGMMSSSEFSDAETKDLLDKRNNAWVPQLDAWMKENSLFVAVGALHLTGETGMIQQLRKLGYTVEPVSNVK